MHCINWSSKKVLNQKKKETTIHYLLSLEQINPKLKFFKVSITVEQPF